MKLVWFIAFSVLYWWEWVQDVTHFILCLSISYSSEQWEDFKMWRNNFERLYFKFNADTKDTESPQCLREISESRELEIANTDLSFGNKQTNKMQTKR